MDKTRFLNIVLITEVSIVTFLLLSVCILAIFKGGFEIEYNMFFVIIIILMAIWWAVHYNMYEISEIKRMIK